MNDLKNGRGYGEIVYRDVTEADDPSLRADLFSLLLELRPGLSQELFHRITTDGYAQGLRFVVAYAGGGPVAAAGYRVLFTSRGAIFYVDDLVTATTERSRGVAGAVLAELTHRARAAGCVRLELDSGVTNTTAHRFYLRNRLDITAFHFSTDVEADAGHLTSR